MSYWLVRFGTIEIPKWDATDDLSTGSARDSTSRLPLGGIIDHYGNAERLPLDPGSIKTSFVIGGCDDTTVHNLEVSLRAMLGTKKELVRERSTDDKLQFVKARLLDFSLSRSYPEDKYKLSISMTFRPETAKWRDVEGVVWKFDETPPRTFDSGLVFDFGSVLTAVTSTGQEILVDVDDSDMEVDNSVISFIVTSGSMSALTVENRTNGMFFRWLGTLTIGDELIVDNLKRSVTLNGNDAYNQFEFGPSQIDWLILEKDVNRLIVSFNGSCQFNFNHKWENVWL